MHRPICSTAIGLFITLTPLLRPASAADIEWDANGANPPTGNFNVANNWNPNVVPGSADNAVFNRGAGVAYHVSFPGGAIFDPPLTYTIDFLRVHSNDVTFRDVSTPFTTRPSLRVANPGISIAQRHTAPHRGEWLDHRFRWPVWRVTRAGCRAAPQC
jgi:hypothetical protein